MSECSREEQGEDGETGAVKPEVAEEGDKEEEKERGDNSESVRQWTGTYFQVKG